MSRTDARSDGLRRRPSRTVPAVIVAVVLLCLSVAMVWVAVRRLSSGDWPGAVTQAAGWTAALTWASVTMLVIAGVVVLAGLVLLLCAVVPGKPTALRIGTEPLETDRGHIEVVMTRRSVAKLASARANEVDGVDGVSTTVTGRAVAMSITTASGQREDIQQHVTERVRAALEATGLDPMPRVRAKARTVRS